MPGEAVEGGPIGNREVSSTPPPHLTEAFHAARSHYALAAGLLIAWDLVRVTLDTKQELVGVTINLAAPTAAPLVMLAFMAYCGLRTVVEWHQCDPARRAVLWSRIDIVTSHILGLTALALFAFQRISSINVGQYLVTDVAVRVIVGPVAGALVGFGLIGLWLPQVGSWPPSIKLFYLTMVILGLGGAALVLWSASVWYAVPILAGAAGGAWTGFIVLILDM